MDVELPFLSGYLNVPPQSGFSLNRISKKKSYHRYCLLFKASRHGIERLEISENKGDKNPKIITLENCVKISQDPSPANVIQIVKRNGILTLNTITNEDLMKWTNALQTVAFRDKSGTQCLTVAIEEDNDLYCSSYGEGVFIVFLIPSDTSKRCRFEQKAYMLHLTATELQLKLIEDFNIILANWPYRFIRKYGYRDGKFTFEAGRKCYTGEGIFTFDHKNPQEIFRCMSSKMKFMKKFISGDGLNNIDCGENQLNAVASMEAGSRSPLPLSNQTGSAFERNINQGSISMQGFISSSDSLNTFSFNSASNIVISPQSFTLKNFCNKPPRKFPSTLKNIMPGSFIELKPSDSHKSDKFSKVPAYEPVTITTSFDPNKSVGSSLILNPPLCESDFKSYIPPQLPIRNERVQKMGERDYESIKNITDAWKTLGVNEIRHTESVANEEDCMKTIFSSPLLEREKHSLKNLPTAMTTKIIDIDIGEGDQYFSQERKELNYDRLDFLSPNNRASSGYKTILTVASPTNTIRMCFGPTKNNDYELIASPDRETYRHADDSQLGYGIIQKTSRFLSSTTINNNVENVEVPINNLPISVVTQQTFLKGNATNSYDNTSPDHHIHNGFNYTLVSKPKRV